MKAITETQAWLLAAAVFCATCVCARPQSLSSVQFTSSRYSVSEGADAALITVERLGPTNDYAWVEYATSSGTATLWDDYEPQSGALQFAPGETQRKVEISILNDAEIEGTEYLEVRLENPTGGVFLGTISNAAVAIVDNDHGIGFRGLSGCGFLAKEDAGLVTISVARDGDPLGPVTVDYSATNGSATAGLDFVPQTGTLSFAAGQLSNSFTIQIRDDAEVEGTETVDLILSNPTGGIQLGRAWAELSIRDNEWPGAAGVQFLSTNFAVGENPRPGAVTVIRTGESTGTVSVDFEVTGGTAVAAADYRVKGSSLTFAPLETSKSLPIEIVNDGLVESEETFTASLHNPTGAAPLGWPSNAMVTIHDSERPGSLDTRFTPGVNIPRRWDAFDFGYIAPALALQPDGKILVGGGHLFVPGFECYLGGIARLHPDGSVDETFRPDGAPERVNALALQTDGKIVLAGCYSDGVGGCVGPRLIRLNPDGSFEGAWIDPGSDPYFRVSAIAIQPDGRIVFGAAGSVYRLLPDGSSDLEFVTIPLPAANGESTTGEVGDLVVLSDGKLLVARRFFTGGQSPPLSNAVVRLNRNGTLDPSFSVPTFGRPCGGGQIGCVGGATTLKPQPDGKVIVGDLSYRAVVRLNADGTRDTNFHELYRDPWGSLAIALLRDGKILVGASVVLSTNGWPLPTPGVLRLDGNGFLDATFLLGSGLETTDNGGNPISVAPDSILGEADEQLLVAGDFHRVSGVPRAGLARLNGDGRYVRITGIEARADRAVRIAVNSQPGKRYVLQTSANLVDWSPLSTNTATGYRLDFETPASVESTARFYQAVLLP